MLKIISLFVLILFPLYSYAETIPVTQYWEGEWGTINVHDKTFSVESVLNINHCNNKTLRCDFNLGFYQPTKWVQVSGALKLNSITNAEPLAVAAINGANYNLHFMIHGQDEHSRIAVSSDQTDTSKLFPIDFPILALNARYQDEFSNLCHTSYRMFEWCKIPEVHYWDDKLLSLLTNETELTDIRADMLQECRNIGAPCLIEKYKQKVASAIKKKREIDDSSNQKLYTQYKKLNHPGNPNKGSNVIDLIEGVYKNPKTITYGDSKPQKVEDILEIVRVAKNAAYIKLHLGSCKYYACEISGVSRYQSNGTFILTDNRYENDLCVNESTQQQKDACNEESSCIVTFSVSPGMIITSQKGDCHLGKSEGAFDKNVFLQSKRRVIRYLDRLKQSSEYQNALLTMNTVNKDPL